MSDSLVVAPLESELRELIIKLQHSFHQLLHPSTSIVGESYDDTNGGMLEEGGVGGGGGVGGPSGDLENDLNELIEIGGGITASGIGGGGSNLEKQKSIPQRRSIPIEKVAYSQLQASAMKQAYQATVHANNLVHHAHSLLGLVSRLKLAVLLAQSAQDRSRQGTSGVDVSSASHECAPPLPLPLEASHPSQIPNHLFPLHLQRTQQQFHLTAMELQVQVDQAERQLEDELWQATQNQNQMQQ